MQPLDLMMPPRSCSFRSPERRKLRARGFLAFVIFAVAAPPSLAQAEVLTNAAQVLSLPVARGGEQPVKLKGIVTVSGWGGRFFLQDSTGGVFVDHVSETYPKAGDVVEINGFSAPGGYAPVVATRTWEKLGQSPLPEARRVPVERIMSGAEDCQRVEVEGIVRTVTVGKESTDVEIASGGYRLHAFVPDPTGFADNLVGAKVRVRGTAAASFNAALRQLLSVVIFLPASDDFTIVETESINPFRKPVIASDAIAQYRPSAVPGERIHVKGVVTLQRRGEDIFIEDDKGGLRLKSHQKQIFLPGAIVEAVGFPEFENFHIVLQDSVFRPTQESGPPIPPRRVTLEEIESGLHHGKLITLSAKVLDRNFRQAGLGKHGPSWIRTVVLLQHDSLTFTAEADTPEKDSPLMQLQIGSAIEVTGVCFTQLGDDKTLAGLQVLMPDAASFRLIKRPAWWTPQRLLIILVLLIAASVVGVIWTVGVAKRNAILRTLVHEKEAAQAELQVAHDLLEDRVKERTEQLKFQISARKESEVQFKAVITERTRLAQELHDTLEQSLTGISLQLDAASRTFTKKPQTASHHLKLACEQVAQSHLDVRRSIWDLRSRALEQFDLTRALEASINQLTSQANIHVNVSARGRVRPLPEVIEDNLLRIAQEAMTNVVKHSYATTASVELDYGPKHVMLRIADDGLGFEPDRCAGPGLGHFGLLGMAERAKRLGGEISISSKPKGGTVITLRVPIDINSNNTPEAT